MSRGAWSGLAAAALGAAAVLAVVAGSSHAASTSPRTAAAALIARVRAEEHRAHADPFVAASSVVNRHGRLWLAIGSTPDSGTRVRVYGWTGREWTLRGTVSGSRLSPAAWISAASVTGSRDPDFAIQGCGA